MSGLMLLHLSCVSQTVVILICSSLLFQWIILISAWAAFWNNSPVLLRQLCQDTSVPIFDIAGIWISPAQKCTDIEKILWCFWICKSVRENMSIPRNFNELYFCLYVLFVVAFDHELYVKSTLSGISASFCRVLDGDLTLFWSQHSQTGMPTSSF